MFDNLLVRIHFVIEMIQRSGLVAWVFDFPFPGSPISTFPARYPALHLCFSASLHVCISASLHLCMCASLPSCISDSPRRACHANLASDSKVTRDDPPRSYVRLIDSCITQSKAQGPSRTCTESKKEGGEDPPRPLWPSSGRGNVFAYVGRSQNLKDL